MAALDFPASPADGQVFNAPNGATYVFNASISAWIASGQAQPVFIGLTPPTSPFLGQLWFKNDDGVTYIYYNDGNSSQWVPATAPNKGSSLTVTPTYDTLATAVTDSTLFAAAGGDSVMQITNGTQLFSRSFTANNPANPIEVDVTAMLGSSAQNWVCLALFIDGAAAAVAQQNLVAPASMPQNFRVYWQGVLAPGAHTFAVRFGGINTSYALAQTGTRIGGGAMRESMVIREVGQGVQGPAGPTGPSGPSVGVLQTIDDTTNAMFTISGGGPSLYQSTAVVPNTTGVLLFQRTITPLSATSFIEWDCELNWNGNADDAIVFCLYRDGVHVRSVPARVFGSGYGQNARIRYRGPSNSLAPTTIMLRGWVNTSGALFINGTNAGVANWMGGAVRSGPIIKEVTV